MRQINSPSPHRAPWCATAAFVSCFRGAGLLWTDHNTSSWEAPWCWCLPGNAFSCCLIGQQAFPGLAKDPSVQLTLQRLFFSSGWHHHDEFASFFFANIILSITLTLWNSIFTYRNQSFHKILYYEKHVWQRNSAGLNLRPASEENRPRRREAGNIRCLPLGLSLPLWATGKALTEK